jgi:hypothetical protein
VDYFLLASRHGIRHDTRVLSRVSFRIPLLLLLLCQVGHAIPGQAHEEPPGDVRPQVLVAQGLFHVVFYSNVAINSRETPMLRTVYTPEGKVLIPRHQVTGALLPKLSEQMNGADIRKPEGSPTVKCAVSDAALSDVIALSQPNAGKRQRVVLSETVQGVPRVQPLPLVLPEPAEITDSWIGKTHVALLWTETDLTNPNDQKSLLRFGWVRRDEFTEPDIKLLGASAQVYGSSIASHLVWCNGRLWVAWVRLNPANGPGRFFEAMLSCYDPVTNQAENKALPGPACWNSQVSLATTNGWLCAAWQCTLDAASGGTSQIITAFEKAPPKP